MYRREFGVSMRANPSIAKHGAFIDEQREIAVFNPEPFAAVAVLSRQPVFHFSDTTSTMIGRHFFSALLVDSKIPDVNVAQEPLYWVMETSFDR